LTPHFPLPPSDATEASLGHDAPHLRVEECPDMDWPLLAGIPEEDCQRFLAIARRRRFAKGEVVFHAGDPGDSLYLVARGRFAIRGGTVLGDTVMLRVIGTGSFFGELALVGDDRRSATVTALEPSETLTIVRHDFEALRARHTSVDRVLVAALAQQVRRMSDLMTELLYLPAERRVLRRLLEVAELWGGARPGAIVPFTQEDLAGLAGTTRPTANRTLRQAEAAGHLRLSRGRIELLDPSALAAQAHLR
jgi:CRP/FNR family cyclic AMP-dependent transcriptional regulator